MTVVCVVVTAALVVYVSLSVLRSHLACGCVWLWFCMLLCAHCVCVLTSGLLCVVIFWLSLFMLVLCVSVYGVAHVVIIVVAVVVVIVGVWSVLVLLLLCICPCLC